MNKKISIIIIALLASCQFLVAQYDAQFSNYWAVWNYYNPAYAGESGNLEATAMNRQQWLGFDNAPKSLFVSAEMPLKLLGRIHGVGASMFSESIGLNKTTIISGQYAYKKKLWKGSLSVGIQGGMIEEVLDGVKAYVPKDDDFHEGTDESIPTGEVKAKRIDISLGAYFSRKQWYAGISSTHMLEPMMASGQDTVSYIPRHYYLMGGYNIPLNNPLLELRSSAILKTVFAGSQPITKLDLSVRLVYNKTFWGGLSWRNSDAVIVMLGGQIKMIQAGYAYDYPISGMGKASSGSHEIFVKYIFDLNFKKGSQSKHKSVRIL